MIDSGGVRITVKGELCPPQNIEAERAVLGAILMDGESFKEAKEYLTPEDFYRNDHQEIFKVMSKLSQNNEPIDIITVGNNFQNKPLLTELAMEVVTSALVRNHAKIVADMSKKRTYRNYVLENLQNIDTLEVDELIDSLNDMAIKMASNSKIDLISYKDVMKNTCDYVERRMQSSGALSGIPSGLTDLDNLTDGWQNNNVIVVAARPSVGKSALALHFAHVAAEHGHATGILSLEMGDQEWGIRSLAQYTGISINRFRKGYIKVEDYGNVFNQVSHLAGLPIYCTFEARSIDDMEKTAVSMIQKHNVKFLIIDYLQLVKGRNDRQREQEVASVSRAMKYIATKYKIPVMPLAQLNRGAEQRKEFEAPKLSDLRESGQIEADADIVLMLYPDRQENVLNIRACKGRNTGLSTIQVVFDKSRMQFRDMLMNG